MAYSKLIASVDEQQVVVFREGKQPVLEANLSIRCSHLLTSWVRPDDLRNSLRQAIDGGERLHADLWHPLRVPTWHSCASAAKIEQQLRSIWGELLEKSAPLDPSDWYGIEIAKVLKVFGHAAGFGNGIVSFLGPPADLTRAGKVSIPVIDRDANGSRPI
jgi:hypothetical protein